MAKRGTDHSWDFIKYSGDLAYYARCKCGFQFSCYKNTELGVLDTQPAPEYLYRYCPSCGARKKRYESEVIHIKGFSWGELPEWDEDK